MVTQTGLRFAGRRVPCSLGRTGVTRDKAEGDGATPAGILRITGCLFRPDRLRRPVPWARAIGLRDLWSDDPADPAYNHPVRGPHPFRYERLRRADSLYDLVLTTDWNADGVPGKGSAIFVHRWRRPGAPTAGCVALDPRHLLWIARRIRRGTRLVIYPVPPRT